MKSIYNPPSPFSVPLPLIICMHSLGVSDPYSYSADVICLWFIRGCLLSCIVSISETVLLLCFSPAAATLPNGPADMRSAVMITSRDFLLVSLSDGRLWDQINNQPTVAAQVTIFISYFLFDLGERFQPATQGPFPLICSLPPPPPFLSDKTSEQTTLSLKLFFSEVVFEVCEKHKWLTELLNVGMKRSECTAANSHITIHACGLFCFMRMQYSSSNHFSSIVILF